MADPSEEFFEPMESVLQKAKTIAGWIRESKHFIAFTGAGVSTSTGIPDFRGPQGVWTMRDKGVVVPRGVTLNKIPSASHMSLLQLSRNGTLKYLVSQNTDGLHRRSGFLPQFISELHGNSTRESCPNCRKEYIRDFSTRGPSAKNHTSGRICECGGELQDTIINFGESLPAIPINLAFNHAQIADLCVVLGSSLKVTPAADIPKIVGKRKGSRLVICNLQPTPLDNLADIIVHAKCDDLMKAICAELGVNIPDFTLERRLCVTSKLVDKKERLSVTIKGEDVDGTPATFLKAVKLVLPDFCATKEFVFEEEEAIAKTKLGEPIESLKGRKAKATLRFMGWYNEPDLDIEFSLAKEKSKILLLFQPSTGKWQVLENN